MVGIHDRVLEHHVGNTCRSSILLSQSLDNLTRTLETLESGADPEMGATLAFARKAFDSFKRNKRDEELNWEFPCLLSECSNDCVLSRCQSEEASRVRWHIAQEAAESAVLAMKSSNDDDVFVYVSLGPGYYFQDVMCLGAIAKRLPRGQKIRIITIDDGILDFGEWIKESGDADLVVSLANRACRDNSQRTEWMQMQTRRIYTVVDFVRAAGMEFDSWHIFSNTSDFWKACDAKQSFYKAHVCIGIDTIDERSAVLNQVDSGRWFNSLDMCRIGGYKTECSVAHDGLVRRYTVKKSHSSQMIQDEDVDIGTCRQILMTFPTWDQSETSPSDLKLWSRSCSGSCNRKKMAIVQDLVKGIAIGVWCAIGFKIAPRLFEWMVGLV